MIWMLHTEIVYYVHQYNIRQTRIHLSFIRELVQQVAPLILC